MGVGFPILGLAGDGRRRRGAGAEKTPLISTRQDGVTGDYCVFETSWGWCAVARTVLGVCAFVLPLERKDRADDEIRKRVPGAASVPHGMKGWVSQVQRYFDGEPVDFSGDLDFSAGSEFQRRVWRELCLIPYGQVRTYGGVAMAIGRPEATRAVAGAIGRNPMPLLAPCHRVVSGNGTLGGFSAPGGVSVKRALLALEAVPMFGHGDETRVLG